MKEIKYILSFFLVTCNIIIHSQDVTFRTQLSIDTFDSSINIIKGNLYFGHYNEDTIDIIELSSLSNIDTVLGTITIHNCNQLKNVQGLNNITYIGGNLSIVNNNALTDLDGFGQIQTVSGSINIGENPNLINLNGLKGIQHFHENLYIFKNESLTSLFSDWKINGRIEDLIVFQNNSLINLEGMEKITKCDEISIDGNGKLSTLSGLNNIKEAEYLNIVHNENLINIDNLINLNYLERLFISNNNKLENIDGLKELGEIRWWVNIRGNRNLKNIDGLEKITSLYAHLYISSNEKLINIEGLRNLEILGGQGTSGKLRISSNNSLINIDGLRNLNDISKGGNYGFGDYPSISIQSNAQLTNLNGLHKVLKLEGDLRVSDNILLTNCCGIQQLVVLPNAVTGLITIENNPSECSSEYEIINSCTTSTNPELLKKINVLPNPANEFVRFDISEFTNDIDYFLYNQFGSVIKSGVIQSGEFLRISELENGIYFYKIKFKNSLITGKLIKV